MAGVGFMGGANPDLNSGVEEEMRPKRKVPVPEEGDMTQAAFTRPGLSPAEKRRKSALTSSELRRKARELDQEMGY